MGDAGAHRPRTKAGGDQVQIVTGGPLQSDGDLDGGAPGIDGGNQHHRHGPGLGGLQPNAGGDRGTEENSHQQQAGRQSEHDRHGPEPGDLRGIAEAEEPARRHTGNEPERGHRGCQAAAPSGDGIRDGHMSAPRRLLQTDKG
jgi:hypothetical protein